MDRNNGHKVPSFVPDNSVNDLDTNLGIWEYDINTHVVKWSDGFYTILGYGKSDIECSYAVFFDYLLYHDDKNTFLSFINNRLPNSKPTVQIRLLTKEHGYQWFESTLNRAADKLNNRISGSIINIHQYKLFELKFIKKDISPIEASKVVRIGNWQLDPHTRELTLSKEFYDIYEYKDQTHITTDQLISSFESKHQIELGKAVDDAIRLSKPFDLELLLRTGSKSSLWVRIKGVSVIDDYGHCIQIKGILQDIDKNKSRETSLQSTLDVLSEQNKRLTDFAHIISHNLRSHSGNLQSMITMYDETDSEETKAEILHHIKSVSDSLTQTIDHVNDIVKIQADIHQEKREISFMSTFKHVFSVLRNNITSASAHVEYDFSTCPTIEYLPAYLESIFQNMLTNSIKYRHPDRSPHIKIYSYLWNNHTYLIFEDNGIGIDLAMHGDKIFGMYKTFHQNSDSRGIGLFLTRNQVEAFGGKIEVESTVNVGTKFIIKLN